MRSACIIPVACTLAVAGGVQASFVAFESNSALSTEGLGSFSGSLTWNYGGGSSGTLVVQITNTSLVANGGYLTAFMFRSAEDPALSSMLTSTSDSDFSSIPAGTGASPFSGVWSGGAGLGGDFPGGGSPVPGLGVGASGTFTFAITSSFASSLTANSFLANPYDFVVRFRGFENGGSDKVPGQFVPAPGVLAGLVGLAAAGRRRRR
jgi:hypothetical protein